MGGMKEVGPRLVVGHVSHQSARIWVRGAAGEESKTGWGTANSAVMRITVQSNRVSYETQGSFTLSQ